MIRHTPHSMDALMRMFLTTTLLATFAVPAFAGMVEPAEPAVVLPPTGQRARPEPAPRPRPQGPVQTDRTTHQLKLGSSGALELSNVSGDIMITAGTGNEARLEVVKTARASEEEARELFELVQVDIVERDNRADVSTRYLQADALRRGMRRTNGGVSVAYNVTVPAGTRLRANSVSGSITATGVTGEATFESVSGSIQVVKGGRVASAKSISGSVEVVDTEMDSTFQASSASGSVTLRRVKARRLDLSSISGNVLLEDVDATAIEAQTVSGNARFRGALARNARYRLRSHSGNVQVEVTGGSGFAVNATSFSGSVRSDFPIETQQAAGGRGPRTQALRGVHGDGSAVLDLNTFSGGIVISKR